MRLIIFDVDGTLVDSQNHIVEAQTYAFKAAGLAPPTRERMLSIVGLSLQEAFVVLTDGDAVAAEKLSDAYRGYWQRQNGIKPYDDILYPGAMDTIAALARAPDTMLGIATGKSMRGVLRLIEQCGWQNVFATTQTSDTHPSKPHPSMILRAMEETGVEPQHTWMIGDTTFDMSMAKSAKVHGIGVSWGYHPHEHLVEAGAEEVVHDFAGLLRRLDHARTT